MKRGVSGLVAMALALGLSQAAHAECKLEVLASIPISFVNNQPMVDVAIDGKPAHLRFEPGRQTFLWGSALKDYGLREAVGASLGKTVGPGGTADTTAVQIHELKIGDAVRKDAIYYLLYGVQKVGEAGLFGSDLFDGKNDIEYDFAHNAVRVFKSDGCKGDQVVYWGGNYSVVDEVRPGRFPIQLAGKTLTGSLNPGNEVTFVTPEGARDAGVALQAAGPLPMGMLAGGMLKPIDVSIANFPELAIGDETIKNAPLAVGDIFPDRSAHFLPGIVLGADFARAHRIYVSHEQKKVYFSYVGGALFGDIYKRLGAEPLPPPPQRPKP